PANVAHHEIPDSVHFAEGVQRQDPGMRQLRGDARLATKTLAAVRRRGKIGPKNLDRHESLECRFAREIDRAHSSLSQGTNDLVLLAERRTKQRVKRAIAVGGESGGVESIAAALARGKEREHVATQLIVAVRRLR